MFKYLENSKIDKSKWDNLVRQSKNASVFSFSWYLDSFCSWDAIVFDDFEGAIPLPVSKKLGLKFLFQPNFIQKCSWFGRELSENEQEDLWKILTKKFAYIHFNSNLKLTSNHVDRTNLILAPNSIEVIKQNFSKSLRKNLNREPQFNISIGKEGLSDVIHLYKDAYGNLNPQILPHHYSELKLMLESQPNHYYTCIVRNGEKILAALLFVEHNNRLHYILGAPNKEGRESNALSFGLFETIKKYCTQGYTLDFEGSSIPSVKQFYESFGTVNEGFYEIAFSPSKTISALKKAYSKFKRS